MSFFLKHWKIVCFFGACVWLFLFIIYLFICFSVNLCLCEKCAPFLLLLLRKIIFLFIVSQWISFSKIVVVKIKNLLLLPLHGSLKSWSWSPFCQETTKSFFSESASTPASIIDKEAAAPIRENARRPGGKLQMAEDNGAEGFSQWNWSPCFSQHRCTRRLAMARLSHNLVRVTCTKLEDPRPIKGLWILAQSNRINHYTIKHLHHWIRNLSNTISAILWGSINCWAGKISSNTKTPV